jgi:hypothetical protein
MYLKDRTEYICKLENCECVCHKAPKRRPTRKIENCEKWSICYGVCINYGAKRAKCIIENCNNNRKNNGLRRKIYIVKLIFLISQYFLL